MIATQSMRLTSSIAVLSFTVFALVGCWHNGPAGSNTNSTTVGAATPPANTETVDKTTVYEHSLVSLSAGAFPVKVPSEAYGHSAVQLIDERRISAWRAAAGSAPPFVFVFALPDKTLLNTLVFDCNYDLFNADGACAKDVTVEMSDVSDSDGFQKIADATLASNADNQKIPVSADVPGRWVRLTIKSNNGSKDTYQLNDFRATGTQLTQTALTNISGTYETDNGRMYLKQDGALVTGCYEYLGKTDNFIQGGVDGRIVNLTYCRYCDDKDKVSGPAIFIFSPNTGHFLGLYWDQGAFIEYGGNRWDGKKTADTIGKCRQWDNGEDDQIAKDLADGGRARVYGINFDTDSDRIKDESKPVLDKITGILKAKPDLTITIEGHTDSTATPQHNQDLSERRASSVKGYLVASGIDATRLKTAGFGSTKPVASNDSELGRAQNRRVELAKL